MEVRLKTGLLENKIAVLTVEPEELAFYCRQEELRIPYKSLTRVYVTGQTEEPRRFALEAGGKEYEGCFLSGSDGAAFIEQLRRQVGNGIVFNEIEGENVK